jgi:type VI secretion system protein VasI
MEPKKLVGALLLGLLALWIVGWASLRSHKSDTPQLVQASPTDKWRVTESNSPMDDSKTVVLTLVSENEIQGPIGAVKPSLIVRCQQKKTDLYVVTGMAASVEVGFDGGPRAAHKVGIRLDEEEATYRDWYESGDNKALFAGDMIYDSTGHRSAFSGGVIELVKRVSNASKLTFQFTPFDGSPQVAAFDLKGLDDHLHAVAEACGWGY